MKMYYRVIISLIIAIFCVSGTFAEQQRYVEYTIKKGDTLWDISGVNLTDPFLWPKIWKENPFIKNPDLIYPGQKIRIPFEILQKQVELPVERKTRKEAVVVKKESPIRGIKIEPKEVSYIRADEIATAGYISKEIPEVAKIISNPEGRTIIAQFDTAYISVLKGKSRPGRLFYSIRPVAKVQHPDTKEEIGYLIEITGILKITGKEAGYTKAEVVKAYSEIEIGDRLDDYYEIEPVPLLYTKASEVKGTIVAARSLKTITGKMDVVYLDRGSKDGLHPGDVLTVISSSAPRRPIGKIQILDTKDTTSTAMVIESLIEIKTGDIFVP